MDRELAAKLADIGIQTRDDLAELAIDELMEATQIEEQAGRELILRARAHWFAEEENAAAQAASGSSADHTGGASATTGA
jgi:N utilization substance protein A